MCYDVYREYQGHPCPDQSLEGAGFRRRNASARSCVARSAFSARWVSKAEGPRLNERYLAFLRRAVLPAPPGYGAVSLEGERCSGLLAEAQGVEGAPEITS